MKRRILLLTLWFPFGNGESFLETELPYLTEKFDVEIVPCLSWANRLSRRKVPSGVVVHEELARTLPLDLKGKIAWLTTHVRTLSHAAKMIYAERKRIGHQWRRFRGFLGFSAHSMMTYTFLKSLCSAEEISGIYSYWLTVPMAWRRWKEVFPNIPLFARAHGMDLYEERSPLRYLYGQRQTVENAERIFCVSENGAAWLKKKYPEFQDKICVSRLGVPAATLRNRGNTKDKFHIVTCSYLVPWKRLSLIIEALSQCSFSLEWTHLGGGELEKELRYRAGKILHRNVRWKITGELPHEKILQFYQETPVDLFVNVSEAEGLPVSIMEAMSYGIPVAATDVGGIREVVIPGENGCLWPVDVSPREILETLQWFSRLPEEKKQGMREAAWRIWHERVNAEKQYPAFIGKLQETVFSEGVLRAG